MLLQKYCSSILLFMLLLLQTLLWIKLLLLSLLNAVECGLPNRCRHRCRNQPTLALPQKSHVAHYIESVLRAG